TTEEAEVSSDEEPTPETETSTSEEAVQESSSQESSTSNTVAAQEEAPVANTTNNSGSTTSNNNSGSTTSNSNKQNNTVTKPKKETVTPVASNNGDVISTAKQYIGVPYVWGGRTPSGFDCSGFVQYVYKQATGRDVGTWTVPQESAGTQISVSQAQAGDLLFWGSKGGSYNVAISLGGSSFIHAPQPGESVKIGNTQYFQPSFAVRM